MTSMGNAAPLHLDLSRPGQTVTLAEALQQARQAHQQDPRREVIITLPAGTMTLDQPLALSPDDSYLTVQGAPGPGTTLTGGRQIGNWQPLAGGLWAAEVPEVKSGQWDFRSLVVEGQWRRRAYLPREGFFEHRSEYKEPWRSTTGGGFGQVPVELKRTMIYRPEDLGPWLSTANAELVIYHSWDMSHARIEAHDPATQTLTLTPPLGFPAGAFGIKRYRVENVAEGLHEPGMWYLDREQGRVVYWPLPGENLTTAEVIAPVATELVKISGRPDQPVQQLRLRNLTLAHTNVSWKSPGFGAAGIAETALMLNHGVRCELENLRFHFIAGNAIKIHAGEHNRIAGCEISHTGAAGIVASGTPVMGVGDHLVVEDNHLHHIGLVYPAAIALRVGNVAEARLCRNLIHDVGYSGITFGGDMKNPRAINGLIENNHIYRVMTALNDGAAIYLSAQIDGTVVRGNVCHDIHGLTGMGWGIYPDEQSRFLTVVGNLVYRCLGSFHCHMAHNIVFENNIGVQGGQYQMSLAKSHDITLRRNIFVCHGEPVFHANVSKPAEVIKAADGNLYYDVGGERPRLGKISWEAWLADGLDANAVFADPLFVNPARDNYELQPDSPAWKLGFARLDLARVPKTK